MPISIRAAGATFTHVVASLTLPDLNNVIAEYVLGQDASHSIINRAATGSPATVVGAPTYSPNSVGISGGGFTHNGFDTGLTPTTDLTCISLAQPPGTNQISPIQSAVGGQSIIGLELAGGNAKFWNSQWSSAPDNPQVSLSGYGSNFVFIAGTGVLGQPGKCYYISGGATPTAVVSTGGSSGAGSRNTTQTMKIGVDATGTGTVAYVCMFARALTQTQLLDVYASLRAFYAGKISIA